MDLLQPRSGILWKRYGNPFPSCRSLRDLRHVRAVALRELLDRMLDERSDSRARLDRFFLLGFRIDVGSVGRLQVESERLRTAGPDERPAAIAHAGQRRKLRRNIVGHGLGTVDVRL